MPRVAQNASLAMFADDSKCYKVINQEFDIVNLQRDLYALSTWSVSNELFFQSTKCVNLRISRKRNSPPRTYSLSGISLEVVKAEKELGILISGADEDVKSRVGKARQAFNNTPRPVWNPTSISTKTKLRIFTTNVKSVLLYGPETWRVTRSISKKLQTFINKCLRKILKIYWPEKISNRELWARTGQECVPEEIARRKWKWIGHTLRKPTSDITRKALEWNPQGKRKVGRPVRTWRRSVEEELKQANITLNAAKRTAANRVRWRNTVSALCFTRNPMV